MEKKTGIEEICAALERTRVETEEEMQMLTDAVHKAAGSFVEGDPEHRAFIAATYYAAHCQSVMVGLRIKAETLLANVFLNNRDFRNAALGALKAVCDYAGREGGGDEKGD